ADPEQRDHEHEQRQRRHGLQDTGQADHDLSQPATARGEDTERHRQHDRQRKRNADQRQMLRGVARHPVPESAVVSGFWHRMARYTAQHLALVGISLSLAIVLAVPLGVLAARRRRLGQVVIGLTGILQTVPSLALFVFMIPLFGIGAEPAIAALFLYSLLPIVRNTHAGLTGIQPSLLESAA